MARADASRRRGPDNRGSYMWTLFCCFLQVTRGQQDHKGISCALNQCPCGLHMLWAVALPGMLQCQSCDSVSFISTSGLKLRSNGNQACLRSYCPYFSVSVPVRYKSMKKDLEYGTFPTQQQALRHTHPHVPHVTVRHIRHGTAGKSCILEE